MQEWWSERLQLDGGTLRDALPYAVFEQESDFEQERLVADQLLSVILNLFL
jgi:hypothetical protein